MDIKKQIKVYDIDNIFIGMMNIGKAKHYVKINQAKFIDNKSIILNFKPKIIYNQIFGCSICSNTEGELIKRSIIPQYLKSFLPKNKKKEISDQIVIPICPSHSTDMDKLSSFYVKELLNELDIKNEDNDISMMKIFRDSYMKNKNIHKNAVHKIKEILKLSQSSQTSQLEEITLEKIDEYLNKTKPHGQKLMEYIIENNLVDSFIENWKTLFIENMKPVNYI